MLGPAGCGIGLSFIGMGIGIMGSDQRVELSGDSDQPVELGKLIDEWLLEHPIERCKCSVRGVVFDKAGDLVCCECGEEA